MFVSLPHYIFKTLTNLKTAQNKKLNSLILILLGLSLSTPLKAEIEVDTSTTISFFGSSGAYSYKNDVFLSMLELSLEKTQEDFGSYNLVQTDLKLKQSRVVEEMRKHCPFDLTWLVSSRKRERDLVAVKIPLLKGLFGLRVPMIHSDSKQLFDDMQGEVELQQLTGGLGHDWPDTKILQHNGYNILPIVNFRALFDLLSTKKIDYIPRSVAEIYDELAMEGNGNLISYPNVLLHYPSPIYFFICPDKKELAERIKTGLKIAIEDGSFDEVFRSSREYKAFERLKEQEIKDVFEQVNPELDNDQLPEYKNSWLAEAH